MDTSPDSSDPNFSVYCSPDESTEPPKTERIRSSVSVSSLAEKFEKGGESIKCEDVFNGSGVSELNDTTSESPTEVKECNSALQDNSQNTQFPEFTSKGDEIKQSGCKESVENSEVTPSSSENGSNLAGQELENKSGSSVMQSSSAGSTNSNKILPGDNSELPQISRAVEERVAYFISKATQISSKTDSSNISERKDEKPKGDIQRPISLKDLEHSFVTALEKTNESEADTATDALLVPSIEITAASDREDSSSDDSLEPKPKKEVKKTETKQPVGKTVNSDSNIKDETVQEPIPSTSAAFQVMREEKNEISSEERKAFFYLSSTELPPGLINATLESSDNLELRQRSTNQQEPTENVTASHPETRDPSCLCSKTAHGALFLSSFIVGIFGFMLYGFANEGKVPDFCKYLGFVTAIIAGIVGAFSCFCFTFLEAFPRLVVPGYERLVDAESAQSRNRNIQAQSLDDESWSSEKERAFRRQNNMSSTRTSAASLRRTPSDPQELIEKTEKLKKQVVELFDSFAEMIRLEETDVSDVETGMADERV